jgi:S1-C subfamily serine protease
MRRLAPFVILAALLTLVVLGARTPAPVVRLPEPRGDLLPEEQRVVDMFKRASRSVVHIRTTALVRNIFSRNPTEQLAGEGTGFVWNETGYLVTNFHVVRGAERCFVILADSEDSFVAKVVGVDPSVDLAVLKIEPPAGGLVPLPLGTSSDLQVGQSVFAIGNPFGYDQTLTTGVISALEREIESVIRNPIRGVIQTDAAINPGNSGGPLLDSAGRMIGVNTMIYTPSGASAGIGFAVPVDTVSRAVPEIIRTGQGPRTSIGLSVAVDRWARARRIPGVVIAEVKPGGAADRAGLKAVRMLEDGRHELGDVIVGVDDRKVTTQEEFALMLLGRAPGDKVRLSILREKKVVEVEVVLDALQ